jgi:hypothetical protein
MYGAVSTTFLGGSATSQVLEDVRGSLQVDTHKSQKELLSTLTSLFDPGMGADPDTLPL